MLLYLFHSNIKSPKTNLVVSPYNNTQSGSTDNITISAESTTIPASTSTFANKYILETTIQSIFDIFDKVQKKPDNNDEIFDKQHE